MLSTLRPVSTITSANRHTTHNNLTHTHTHTRLTALFPGLPGSSGTRKAKPIWILMKQEIVSGSGISWAICKFAPSSRQITMPAPHHSVFYRPDALPAAQPTASKHWRQIASVWTKINKQHVDKSVHKYDIQNTSRLKICLKYIKSNTHMHMHTCTRTHTPI